MDWLKAVIFWLAAVHIIAVVSTIVLNVVVEEEPDWGGKSAFLPSSMHDLITGNLTGDPRGESLRANIPWLIKSGFCFIPKVSGTAMELSLAQYPILDLIPEDGPVYFVRVIFALLAGIPTVLLFIGLSKTALRSWLIHRVCSSSQAQVSWAERKLLAFYGD